MVGGQAAAEARAEFVGEHPVLVGLALILAMAFLIKTFHILLNSDFEREAIEVNRKFQEREYWAAWFKRNFFGAKMAYQEHEADKEFLDQATANIRNTDEERIDIPGVSIPDSANKKTR